MPNAREQKLRRFIEEAPAGARFQYHLGNLARDREATVALTPRLSVLVWPDVEATASLAMAEATAHRVFLVQERMDDDLFAYWAVKASDKWTKERAR